MTAPEAAPPSERSRIRRLAQRGHYDRATLHAVIDAAYVCHVAFTDDHGVHCIPTACWRDGDYLYIHGSNGSRMLKLAASRAQVCVTITHLDGLVLARSAFNHSMNYRSAVIYGEFDVIADALKSAALDTLMEHIAPGRSREARPGDTNELAATTILRIPLDEAACKISSSGPEDDEADLNLPVWAGVLPLALQPGMPVVVAAPRGTPDYVERWQDAAVHRTAVDALTSTTS
ncbi:pyridoxamine 5'-phosphate oxidase family protein [Burkholderia sp. 9120]|uniref:pyridoxamine 5'-phosphate oxidase family protein n=1 Tax=Burkholderia sp. 9120 TaxID=1500897 RepID=UPI00055975B6|nr:pyridoxamine 5'-phosphate oxidase family protein [Burkholderia sp. 9120]